VPGRPTAPVRVALLLALSAVIGACGPSGGAADEPSPTGTRVPGATCGGPKIAIEGALPCERIVAIALETLGGRAPDQVARGVASIEAVLSQCPRGEMPPQVDCRGAQFAQLVTVTFGPAPQSGPIEPSLTVAIEPVSGRVLGIVNPLIR
jgi:hypothetical protein